MLDSFLTLHSKRIVGLDIMRSTAILFVIYIHGKMLIPEQVQKFYDNLVPIYMDGVSIFFVLSGFLIGGILLKIIKNTKFNFADLLNFWIRRWFRTVPNYFLIMLLLASYKILVLNKSTEISYKYFVFTQNLYQPHPSFFPAAWSLTVEEWFYLIFPFVIFLLVFIIKSKRNALVITTLFFLIVPLIFRLVKYYTGLELSEFDAEIRKVVIFRLDSLMYGVIGAYVFFKSPKLFNLYKYHCLVFGIILSLVFFNSYIEVIKPTSPLIFNLEAITCLMFLPYLNSLSTTGFRVLDSFFIFISIISYSMYLLNLSIVLWIIIPIIHHLMQKYAIDISGNYILNFTMFLGFTLFGSYFLYKIYENPMTNLRDKLSNKE